MVAKSVEGVQPVSSFSTTYPRCWVTWWGSRAHGEGPWKFLRRFRIPNWTNSSSM